MRRPSLAALDRRDAEVTVLMVADRHPHGIDLVTLIAKCVNPDGHLKAADYTRAIGRLLRRKPPLLERFEDHFGCIWYRRLKSAAPAAGGK